MSHAERLKKDSSYLLELLLSITDLLLNLNKPWKLQEADVI